MNAFTIKDLENLSGIRAHTIRVWEQRYSFLNPQRTETNIRYYSNGELQKILNIALLNKCGYKISHINRMKESEIQEKILGLSQAEACQERIVNELIGCMADVRMDDFEEVLDNYIRSKGIEKAVAKILFPFLERIGILWLTNHINPAQEHLVSNLIRQKLVVAIDSLRSTTQSAQKALLFLPEGEQHEIGLLYMHFLLKSHGVNVIYLGANVPMRDVAYVAGLKNPDFLYTHLTSVAQNFRLDKFLARFQKHLPDNNLIVSGMVTQSYRKKLPPNCTFKRSLAEVNEFVALL